MMKWRKLVKNLIKNWKKKTKFDTMESDEIISLHELFNKKEDLREELQPYLSELEGKITMTVLKHPLVFGVPYYPQENALYNKQYEAKTKAIEDCLKEKKYLQYIFFHERPYRIDAF